MYKPEFLSLQNEIINFADKYQLIVHIYMYIHVNVARTKNNNNYNVNQKMIVLPIVLSQCQL